MQFVNCLNALLISSSLLTQSVDAINQSNRRTFLIDLPTLSQSGYVVPLQGSETCFNRNTCISALPPPPTDKTLRYLAVARGINTYNCTDRNELEPPLFNSQIASLWDAAPLLPQIPDEEYFHTLIKQLHEFDYTAMKNSSLTCIGSIHTTNVQQSVFEIFNVADFTTTAQATVNAPNDPVHNLQWAYSTGVGSSWAVYRVEVDGGAPPSSCKAQSGKIELDYAAEYWFYY